MSSTSIVRAPARTGRARSEFLALSPILLVLLNNLVAVSLRGILGVWVWTAVIGAYVAALAALVLTWGGMAGIRTLLAPSRNEWIWKVVATLFGLLVFPVLFLPNYRLLLSAGPAIWISCILVAIVIPWAEELYWRGVVFRVTASWPLPLTIVYSSLLFAAVHSAFAWTSVICRQPTYLVMAFMGGVVYSLIAWRLASVRWVVFSHFIVELFSLSALAWLNIIVLPK